MPGASEGLRAASMRRVSGLAGRVYSEGGQVCDLLDQIAVFLVIPFREKVPFSFRRGSF